MATRQTRRRSAVLSATMLVATASCSSGEASVETSDVTTSVDGPTSTDPPTTTSATIGTTTAVPPTTTVPVQKTTTTRPTDVVETFPEPENTTPDETTTTEPTPDPSIPVDTMFDPATVEGQVEQVVLADTEAYKQCLRELPNCDVDAATRFGLEAYADDTAALLERFNADRRIAENADGVLLSVQRVEFRSEGPGVDVFACLEDRSRLFAPDDPSVPVLGDEMFSMSRRYLLFDVGGVWLIEGFESLDVGVGEERNLCG